MSDQVQVARATLTDETRSPSTPIKVHFNPSSLQITVTNVLKSEGKGCQKTQHVGETTTKLGMDLIFDTTHTGKDVRSHTTAVAALMEAVDPNAQNPKVPVVLFVWGTFRFRGTMDSYTETIDFFSPDGVPLRSTVKISFTKQCNVFAPGGTSVAGALDTVEAPVTAGDDVTDIAKQAGDLESSGRWMAASNDLETMRFPTGVLTIDLGVSLSPPAPFASGEPSGMTFDGNAPIGLATSVTGSGPTFGGAASAGVSASAGAFAGLRTTPSGRSPRGGLDAMRLLSGPASAGVATSGVATFRLGGGANIEGAASLASDVGTVLGAPSRIQFSGG